LDQTGNGDAAMTNGKAWTIGDMAPLIKAVAAEPLPEGRRGDTCWFVVQVAPGAEKAVAEAVRALGLSAYVPMRTIFRRVSRSRRRVKARPPLFARYVFVDLVPDPRCWAAVRVIKDVSGFLTLTNDAAPARIAEETIGDLMAAEDMGFFDETRPVDGTVIRVSTRVVIIAAPYVGFEGVVEARGRKVAYVRLICSRHLVTVPVDGLVILP
jgi:transcription antitermination factor NusG